jgi:hypothetical protein
VGDALVIQVWGGVGEGKGVGGAPRRQGGVGGIIGRGLPGRELRGVRG